MRVFIHGSIDLIKITPPLGFFPNNLQNIGKYIVKQKARGGAAGLPGGRELAGRDVSYWGLNAARLLILGR